MKVHCVQEQTPPWHDMWAVEMDGASLLQLSAELLSMSHPLTPRLAQMSRLLESVISKGLDSHQADWDNGLGSRNLQEMCDLPKGTVNDQHHTGTR
jgi:hypothetical protein